MGVVMQLSLTPKQKRLMAYLQRQVAEQGIFPSLRQAALDLGISHTAVAQMLKLLEKKERIKREGRYQRVVHLMNPVQQTLGVHRWKEVPVIGKITAGLPIYAQQEWNGSIVIDSDVYRGNNLFALYVAGDSMINAGILNGDLAICEPRQYADNGEIVVALIHQEEATIKRFFIQDGRILLQPENPDYPTMQYHFDEVLVQGKVIGIHRGPEVMQRLNP
jgi:repressor LexA